MHRRTLVVVAACSALVAPLISSPVGAASKTTKRAAKTTKKPAKTVPRPSVATRPAGPSAAPAASPTTSTPKGCTATKPGSILTFGQGSPPRGLDPVVVGGGITGNIEVAAITDVLMRYEPDSGNWVPQLAKSLDHNSDYDKWTLTLREGVKFANGDPLDAQAVRANINRHLDRANASLVQSLAATIKQMDVVNATTLAFTLDGPWTTFPYLLGGPAGMIVNPAVVAAKGSGFSADPNGAGAGPYEVQRYAPGEELILRARPDYWAGPPCIERLRFVFVPGGTATYEAFKKGELDAAFLNDPRSIATARADGHPTFSTLAGGASVLAMNSGYRGSSSPLQDVRLRRAAMQAIETGLINQRVYDGTGIPTRGLLSEKSDYFDGAQTLPYSPAAATAAVTAVKAEGRWNGKIRLDCPATSTDLALTVAAMLKAAGFDVDVNNTWQGSALTSAIITTANYDIACWGINVTDEGLWPKLARQLYSKGSSNYFGYLDPNMDKAIADLRVAKDRAAVKKAMNAVQAAWNDTAPLVVLNSLEQTIVYSKRAKGLVFTQETAVLFPTATVDR